MDKVKEMVAAGVSIPTAIREALGMTISAFADKHDLVRQSVGNHINGTVRATDDTVNALTKELGGTPDEWRELLWLAGRPASSTAA